MDAARGGVAIAGPVRAGGTVVVTVGTAYAGEEVRGWLFSEPVDLGLATVDASGQVRFRIPADTPAGVHRLAVTLADGTLIGWSEVTVRAAGTGPGGLAVTGATAVPLAAAALLLLLGGTALVVTRRRRA